MGAEPERPIMNELFYKNEDFNYSLIEFYVYHRIKHS